MPFERMSTRGWCTRNACCTLLEMHLRNTKDQPSTVKHAHSEAIAEMANFTPEADSVTAVAIVLNLC